MELKKNYFSCERDDLVIRGTEYLPEGENLPIVIVSHGFMANCKTVLQYVEFFARNGFAAYAFDFCGGCAEGKSDGKTTEMSVLTEVLDLKAVIEYVSSLPYTNAGDLTLMGCSQGGFVSALTAAELDARVKKLILFYPAFCIPDDARAGEMLCAKFDPDNPPELFKCGSVELGKQYITDVINMDPYQQISKYSGDVLIVHGTNDDIVDMKYIEEAKKAYESRNCGNADVRYINGGEHTFSRKHDAIAMEYLKWMFRE